ncbi:MAG: CAP domain-containing protein [Oceanipulchritudo sp.]
MKTLHQSIPSLLSTLLAAAVLQGSALNPQSRWQVRDYYNTVYPHLSGVPMGWTGSYTTGTAGSVSADWQEAVRTRVNFYRTMAGIRGEVVFDPGLNAKCQQSSFMMSVNNALSHTPPTSWRHWTRDGYDAAHNGNLAIGSSGVAAIDGYMADFGSNNSSVGHRRWILLPGNPVMGNGDVPGSASFGKAEANTLWIQPAQTTPRPETSFDFIAWPPPGHVPNTLVWPRWSFSHPDADFSNASVQMQSGGQSVPVQWETFQSYLPESTIVWVPGGMNADDFETWPLGGGDETVRVSVNNVRIAGRNRSFQYDVVIFDPVRPGPEEWESEIIPPGKAVNTAPARFTVTTRPWSEGVQGRILTAEEFASLHGAEGGDNPFTGSVSGGYSIIQDSRVAAGSKAFLLTHLSEATAQTLTFSDELLITDNKASLTFSSSLSHASRYQRASVELNSGESGNWRTIWRRAGPVGYNDRFTSESIDLSDWHGKTVRIRFTYSFTEGGYASWTTGPASHVGWAIDNIRLSGVWKINTRVLMPIVWDGSHFETMVETPGRYFLQAREFAFDGFPMDWGRIQSIEVEPAGLLEGHQGRWGEDPILGWVYNPDDDWRYSPETGFLYVREFPWIHTESGWLLYLRGSLDSGLWLYHEIHGFSYAHSSLHGGFLHAPFSGNSWKPF